MMLKFPHQYCKSLCIAAYFIIVYFPQISFAQVGPEAVGTPSYISQVALFARCYGHLTQRRPQLTDPLYLEVKAGTKTAVQACTAVLDKAQFTAASGTKIANDSDQVAKNVLFSMHQLHRSWARDKGIAQRLLDTDSILMIRAWYEDSPIGSYITRALFSPGKTVDSIITGTEFLQPVRKIMDPPHSYGGVPNPNLNPPLDWRLGDAQPFAPRDELLGIRPVSLAPVSVLTPGPIASDVTDLRNIGTLPTATQSFTNINFPTVASISVPITPISTNFGVRFQAKLNITTAGNYTFYLDADDTAVLIIDGERVVATSVSGVPVALSVGLHMLEIEYFQRGSSAKLIFSWQGPNFTKQIVPANVLSQLKGEYFTKRGYPPMKFTGNEGGGFIGSHNYLFTTFNVAELNFVPDGQVKTDRSYARSVLFDTLCREAPLVREVDAVPFVSQTSDTPFRREAGCVACHATLDRLAGATVRGMRWNQLRSLLQVAPLEPKKLYGAMAINFIVPTFAENTTWSAVADLDYPRRAPYGNLYFRNYRGDLIDQPIRSFTDLANSIVKQDDYYICFAKRYYSYFTGIDVVWGDPGDINYPSLSKSEGYHLDTVIKLGLALKQHKSLRKLIIDIISSNEYKMTDYGVTYGGPS